MTPPMIGEMVHFIGEQHACRAAMVIEHVVQTDMVSLTLKVSTPTGDSVVTRVLEDRRGNDSWRRGDATLGTWHNLHEREYVSGSGMRELEASHRPSALLP